MRVDVSSAEDVLADLGSFSQTLPALGSVDPELVDQKLGQIRAAMSSLAPPQDSSSEHDIYANELKRRLEEWQIVLEDSLGNGDTFLGLRTLLGITSDDVHRVEQWLQRYKPNLQKALETRKKTPRYSAEDLVRFEPTIEDELWRVHTIFSDLLEPLYPGYTKSIAVKGVVDGHSAYNRTAQQMQIAIPEIIDPSQPTKCDLAQVLIQYCHEAGHALHDLCTKGTMLPEFLQKRSFITAPSEEGIARHFQFNLIINMWNNEYLRTHLCNGRNSDELLNEIERQQLVFDYGNALQEYFIIMASDKGLDWESRVDTMRAFGVSDKYRALASHSFSLHPHVKVAQMVNLTRPVSRAIIPYERRGMMYAHEDAVNEIDKHILQGYFSPAGMEEIAAWKASFIPQVQWCRDDTHTTQTRTDQLQLPLDLRCPKP